MRQSIQLGDDAWEARSLRRSTACPRSRKNCATTRTGIRRSGKPEPRIPSGADRRLPVALAEAHAWHPVSTGGALRRIALGNPVVPRDIHAEHKALHEAALARDADLACLLGARHIDRTVQVLNRVLATADAARAS